MEYAERLATARKREAQLRKLSRGHVRKKAVGIPTRISQFRRSPAFRCKRLDPELDATPDDGDDEAAFLPDSDEGDDEKNNISPAVLALMRKYVRSL